MLAPDYVHNVLDRLDRVKPSSSGWTARCPAHHDRNNSLSVGIGDEDGVVMLHCFTGCAVSDIAAAIGLTLADLRRPKVALTSGQPLVPATPAGVRTPPVSRTSKSRQNGHEAVPRTGTRLVKVYDYRDQTGQLVAQKSRWESADGREKTFLWRLPDADEWSGLNGRLSLSSMPLWGAEIVAQAGPATPVWYCEGEKAAQVCRDHGLLAVCHGGGANQREFGSSLDVLRGRDVRLWPDHDLPGRSLMALVARLLKGIARQIVTIESSAPAAGITLPDKGDAYEFFAMGGTVAQLDAAVALFTGAPQVAWLTHDALQIQLGDKVGPVTATFREMEMGVRSLDCELTLDMNGEQYTERINLSSQSAKETLRRSLESEFGKEAGLTGLLSRLFALARSTYISKSRVQRLGDIPHPGEPKWAVAGFIPAGVPSLLYGDGSVSKTFTALSLALTMSMGLSWLGRPTAAARVLYVDYEASAESFKFRASRVMTALWRTAAEFSPPSLRGTVDPKDPPVGYLAARGIPFVDLKTMVRLEVERGGYAVVIIDSAAPACGGKPEEADSAIRYFNALASLGTGVTTITLAHVTKTGDVDAPFGSIFWRNLPRITWYLAQPRQTGDPDLIHVVADCKKANDGPLPAIGWTVHFEAQAGPVEFTPAEALIIPRKQGANGNSRANHQAVSHVDQLRAALTGGPMTVSQLAREVYVKADVLGAVLRRHEGTLFAKTEDSKGGRGNAAQWSNLAAPERTDTIGTLANG